ncbi:MAG: hypothetical protein ACYDAK_01980 [Candidatus Limnocylindrales bacterium]
MPRFPLFARPVLRRRTRRAALGGALGLAAMTVLATGTPGSAADSFRAGTPGVEARALAGTLAGPTIALATRSALALGLPPAATRTVSHVTDRFASTEYDEVAEADATGRLTALQRFDRGGRLLAAVRFGWTGDGGPLLRGEGAVRQRGEQLASAAFGAVPDGMARILRGPSGSGWTVSWERSAGGIPVRGDGVRIQLWPDGSTHSVSLTARELAPAPATTIARAAARAIVEAQLDRWFAGADRSGVAITALSLAWTAPNDTFAPERPDAPGSILRLAWVATVGTRGALAQRLGGLELDIDAGDGSLIAGDVIR